MLSLILTTLVFVGAQAADGVAKRYYDDIQIGVNKTNLKSKLYNIEDKIYVPIRALSEYLNIPVVWDENSRTVTLMTDNKKVPVGIDTDIGDGGIIPNEETAYQIGKIILEQQCGRPLEYETDEAIYYLKAKYHPYDNGWSVYQECEYKNSDIIDIAIGVDYSRPTIALNKNTGEVIYINVIK